MSGKSKLHIFALSLGLSIVLTASALAQAPQTAAANNSPTAASSATGATLNAKIGIVNIQDAIIATNEGKKEFDALQARFAPKQNELKGLNDEVENMKKDLQAKGDKLNEDERNKQVKNLEVKQKTLQRNYEDAQNEFQQAEQEVVNRIGGKMLNVLEKYAKTNGYAVILDVSNPQTPVLWASQGTNITKDLVDAYNSESGVPAAPGAKPAAPGTKPSGAAASRPPATGGATTPKKP
ncbi:MAG TPA: OmpH family outer membrane protein [Candidatus Angelobacter sp.]